MELHVNCQAKCNVETRVGRSSDRHPGPDQSALGRVRVDLDPWEFLVPARYDPQWSCCGVERGSQDKLGSFHGNSGHSRTLKTRSPI